MIEAIRKITSKTSPITQRLLNLCRTSHNVAVIKLKINGSQTQPELSAGDVWVGVGYLPNIITQALIFLETVLGARMFGSPHIPNII